MRRPLLALVIGAACFILVSCGNSDTGRTSEISRNSETNGNSDFRSAMPPAQTHQKAEERHLNKSERKAIHSGKAYYRNKVMVLMYHNVKLRSKRASIITVKQLDEQLSAMRKNGFHVISMNQYMDFILFKRPVPDNAVLLTFDDGYETFYTLVFPLLRKHGVTASNFVVVSSIDEPAQSGNSKLTWEQMREMKRAGMSFYNHTYNLHYYAAVDPEGKRRPRPALARRVFLKPSNRMETMREYEIRVYSDLTKAEKRLKEELGNTRSALAFPYGVYSRRALEMAHKAGIDVTLTVQPGINSHGSRNGNRINAGNQRMTPVILMHVLKNTGTLETR